MKQYDVLIIGAGTAGLSAAKVLKKHGAKYAIIEQNAGGTLCAKTGCMPSKALIDAANTYHARKNFHEFGIEGSEELSVNIPRVLQHVRNLRDGFVKGVLDSMKGEPVIRGHARFIDAAPTVQVDDKQYRADAVIICTGSHPRIPEPFKQFESEIFTTDNIFEQKDLPQTMAFVGLGNTGVEFAQAFARLGVDIHAIEASATLAGIADPQINKTAKDILSREFQIDLEMNIEEVRYTQSGFELKSKDKILEAERIFISVGRVPNLKNMGLENAGMTLDEDGIPAFDKITMQVKDNPVYIAGDVNADRAVQHEAANEGKIAALHAIGKGDEKARDVQMKIGFSDPPIASIGKSRDDTNPDNMITGQASYQNQGRAKMMGENEGQIRIYADPGNHCILGAQLMAPAADHTAHLLALAVQKSMTVQELLDMPFYHPTLEEGLRSALTQAFKNLKKAA